MPPPKLTTMEERCAGVNAGFAAFLENVRGKHSPTRFHHPVRQKQEERDDRLSTEEHLAAFFRSLDDSLMPAALADDPTMRRVWTRFWTARNRSCAAFLERFIEETARRQARRIDPQRDSSELLALERALSRSILEMDRRNLGAFVGRRGVDLLDLSYALWRSHSDGWCELATASSVTAAVRGLLGAPSADVVERSSGRREQSVRPLPPNAGQGPPKQNLYATLSRRSEVATAGQKGPAAHRQFGSTGSTGSTSEESDS